MLPAEHVTRLADLVEDLVGSNPDEVGVHQFDHGGVSAIQGDATGQTGEGGFGNRRAKHPIGEGVLESFGCSARPSVEFVDVLAHDHDRVVFLHAAQHHVRDRGDELPLDGLTDEILLFFELDSLEFGEVAADAVVDGCRVRPQRRNKATCSGSVRVVLHESTRHVGHQRRAPGAQVGDLVFGHDPASHHVRLGLLDGVSIAPRSFLCFVAVTEGTSGERSVLVEVAVHIRLDERGAVARAHVLDGLLHR